MTIALFALLVLPDFPTTTRWLSAEEKVVAEWRLISDAAGIEDNDSTDGSWKTGFVAAFKDWRTYVFAAIWFYLISYYSDKRNKIYSVIMFCIGMAFVAYIIALSTLTTGARYFAMMLMPSACCKSQIWLRIRRALRWGPKRIRIHG